MANNEIKTNAEIYREQRKERLQKAAKKKQHSARTDKVIRILVRTLCIVLVAALVLWGAGSLLTSVFCVPQKTLTAAKYGDSKVTVAEYNYYYMALYNQIYSMAYQYESYYANSYGSGYGSQITGFDYTADPASQDYPYDDVEDESIKTWADYFRYMAATRAFLMQDAFALANGDDAKSKGFEIDQETIDADIKSSIDELRETANENDYDLNNYIARVCGEGLTEKSYKSLLNRDAVAQQYLTWYQEYTGETLTDKEVNDYFTEHFGEYAKADFRLFSVSFAAPTSTDSDDPTYTKDQAKARADAFLKGIADEKSFISLAKEYALPSQEETLKDDSATLLADYTSDKLSSVQALADWIFVNNRKVGDKAVILDETNSCYYICYIVSAPTADKTPTSVSVRHILFEAATTTTDSDGNSVDLDAETIKKNETAAKAKADAVLKEWKDGDATEDSFAKLATEKSEDTGSTENGGLYEDINSSSSYVPEFLDWALASHKAGDTGIIKTSYGYHIMYYVKGDTTPKWQSDVRSAIASDSYNTYIDEKYTDINEKVEKNEKTIEFFANRLEKSISLRFSAASSSGSGAATSAS